jgi:hypothetical protein
MRVELEQKSPLKNLHGRVEGAGGPLQGALVEVFLNDEASPNGRNEKREQKRVAACKTAEDGEFCFKNLPSGRYEIRSSIDSGWDVTYVNVTVDVKKGKNQKLRLLMQVGT